MKRLRDFGWLGCALCVGFSCGNGGGGGPRRALFLVDDGQMEALQAEVEALKARLDTFEPVIAYLSIVELPADECGFSSKALRVTGNLQVVNGEGDTETRNGKGNLIIGYLEDNEIPQSRRGSFRVEGEDAVVSRTGSHNLIIGRGHRYQSWGGIASGFDNGIVEPYCVAIGNNNYAGAIGVRTGGSCVTIGGSANLTFGGSNSVFGGGVNTVSNFGPGTIAGGCGQWVDDQECP